MGALERAAACSSLLLKLRSHGAVVVGWEVGDETRFLTSGVLLLDAPDAPFAAQLSAGVTSRSLCPPLVEWRSIVTWGRSALKSAVSASLTASQGTQLQRGKKEMLILKKSKHVMSAAVTAELYVPWHLLSSWAFRGGGFWWCAEMCGAQLSLLCRPEITSVTFTPQVLP